MKMKLSREIIAYLIVGVLTTVVGLVVYYGVTLTILDPHDPLQLQVSNVISWIAAVAFAYVTNRILVFQSKSCRILSEIVKFCAARLATHFMDMGLIALFVSFLGYDDRLMKLIVQAIVIIGNYVLSKFFVFK